MSSLSFKMNNFKPEAITVLPFRYQLLTSARTSLECKLGELHIESKQQAEDLPFRLSFVQAPPHFHHRGCSF